MKQVINLSFNCGEYKSYSLYLRGSPTLFQRLRLHFIGAKRTNEYIVECRSDASFGKALRIIGLRNIDLVMCNVVPDKPDSMFFHVIGKPSLEEKKIYNIELPNLDDLECVPTISLLEVDVEHKMNNIVQILSTEDDIFTLTMVSSSVHVLSTANLHGPRYCDTVSEMRELFSSMGFNNLHLTFMAKKIQA